MRDPDEKGIAIIWFVISYNALCVAVYTPNMNKPHPAVTPVNLQITVSIKMYNLFTLCMYNN